MSALPQEREFHFSDSDFKFIAKLVNEQTGIVLAAHKRDMVYSRLARRLRALGIRDFNEYCQWVQGEGAASEMGNLVNAITTNLTSFFREQHHFEHLREHVLLPMSKQPDRHLRLWSAACSAGMEPYSMAMTLRAAIPSISQWDARILATDIDTNMLKTGAEGIYPEREFDNIPRAYRDQVVRQNEQVLMSQPLKNLIAFKYLNLLQDWPFQKQFHAVFCRNVVIYFDKPTQRQLFDRIADTIVPGGWLYIGHSENLSNVCDRFELCGRTIYRRIR